MDGAFLELDAEATEAEVLEQLNQFPIYSLTIRPFYLGSHLI